MSDPGPMAQTPPPATTAAASPNAESIRIRSIDTLRGVALFGILIVNIIGFAFAGGAYFNPSLDGATESLNLTAYIIMDVFFEGSMRTVFSMLFGAGVVLFTCRPRREEDNRCLWYRRTSLLVLFGLVDAWLLLWIGDILYVYGMTGLLLYLFRGLPPKQLLACGVAALLLHASLSILQYPGNAELFEQVQEARGVPAAIRSDEQRDALRRWEEFQQMNFEDEATNEQARAAYQGSWLNISLFLAPVHLIQQTAGFLFGSLWDAGGMMLLGMALYKWRVFDASRSNGAYWAMALLGLPLGLAVNVWEVQQFMASGFATHLNMSALRPTYDIGRLAMAIGYIGLVMLVCKAGLFRRLTAALASVGQMALTNYLSHSIICGFVLYGYGLGLSGQMERYQVYYIVLAIWAFQLFSTPIWLRHFRFGPLEWLWRSLTCDQKQPLARHQAQTPHQPPSGVQASEPGKQARSTDS